ncbi:hypothetical protein [Paenibacillus odorifer]|uniref:hypothetical protein n=1 Tax=Paenibacillus odorifer TaxID=189426 RepID=UPI0015C3481C|nr:hypothetical protein [Paenibacillus odorifer]
MEWTERRIRVEGSLELWALLFMKVLAQQLVQRGYNGKRISHPRNGGLYVYEQGC